ncbi:flagellar export protein FliJ [Geobacter argillaceus]|uniref:Flagellar FliJ protein n=1 Tax=Geobacter argillaceus TaxID=345631 RepID=A0A562VJN7_9BACT|nr:flagellar export protein FliJ [Geobacter argillaceus]TWJ18031.1 flagellar FliJ protein [Geobacter argillaceus]
MPKDGFRLQQVLNYRREVEKARKQELAVARSEFDNATRRLKSEEEKAERLSRELKEKETAGILALEFQLYAEFSRKQSSDIKNQREAVSTLNEEVEEKREILLSAAKDKKVLESFKDKTTAAHRLDVAAKERNFLDEIAIQGNSRSKK